MTLHRARRLTSLGIAAAVWGSLGLWVSGCTPATQARVVVAGQTFCARATADGPLIVALADASGVGVSVIGRTAQVVAANCALVNGIPVVPPPDPAAAPVVAVVLKP